MRAQLTKDFTFEAAQTLPSAPEGHKCRKMHGHSFKLEISVEGEVDAKTGWIYDHAQISGAMKPSSLPSMSEMNTFEPFGIVAPYDAPAEIAARA